MFQCDGIYHIVLSRIFLKLFVSILTNDVGLYCIALNKTQVSEIYRTNSIVEVDILAGRSDIARRNES